MNLQLKMLAKNMEIWYKICRKSNEKERKKTMIKNFEKSLKASNGITLIALVITIIVLLILAGISISMLSGDNGILQKATDAKANSEKAQIVENARLDILDGITNKKGTDLTAEEIKNILGIYFTSGSIPDNLSDLTQEMKTKSGGYNVKLADVLNGVTIKQEVKETHISKSTEKENSYVGYYADIDDDGRIDGIIYADMLVGNTKNGQWGDSWGVYNITKIEDATSVKDYVISTKTYEGQTTTGKYKANEGFGEKEVLVPSSNSTGTKDRFYVMALEDFKNNSKNRFYWYYNAQWKLNRLISGSENDFGKGKENTINMLNDWNNNTSTYGEQTIASSGKDYVDVWGAIQDNQYILVQTTEDSQKWFVPSKAEWSAYGRELGITKNNYENFGLSEYYWSSTQGLSYCAYGSSFYDAGIYNRQVNTNQYVRLSSTF